MSPSQAGSSHSSSWRIFGSACDLFLSARKFSYEGSKIGRILGSFFENWHHGLDTKGIFFFKNLIFNFHSVLSLLGCFRLEGKTEFNFGCSCLLTWKLLIIKTWGKNEFKICYFLTYILSVMLARFQLGNWSAPARRSLARNLHSSAWLEPETSRSNSSLVGR